MIGQYNISTNEVFFRLFLIIYCLETDKMSFDDEKCLIAVGSAPLTGDKLKHNYLI